jgi:hypothetical protein
MRNLFRKMAFLMLPQCVAVHFILLLEKDNVITWTAPDEDEPAYSTVTGYDFISCGLCVGFWLSLAFVILSGQELADVGRYWGGSYLLTRLTR